MSRTQTTLSAPLSPEMQEQVQIAVLKTMQELMRVVVDDIIEAKSAAERRRAHPQMEVIAGD